MLVVGLIGDVGEDDKTCFARDGRWYQQEEKSKDKRGRHKSIEHEIARGFERNRPPELLVSGRNPGCALPEQFHNGVEA